jgi:hypothetical protein
MCRKKVVFRRFDIRLFLWKCQKRHFWNIGSSRCLTYHLGCIFSNFGLIGCKSTKKFAKMTILKLKVIIRKFKCHQKILWVWFAGNNINNYGLILNTNGARDQNKILMKNSKCFLESAVIKIIPYFLIVSSKSYPRNLLVAFKLSNYHFYLQNCHFAHFFVD